MATAFQSDAFQNNAFQIDVTPAAGGTTPSGVRGKAKKPPVLRFSDVQNREDIGEFLRSQLKLRHPNSAFDTGAQDAAAAEKARKALAKQERREKQMRLKAEREAAIFAKAAAQLEAEQKAQIGIQNDNMKILLMLASSV